VPYGREARRRRQLLTPKLPAPGSWLLIYNPMLMSSLT
jgi:hypothetical protein